MSNGSKILIIDDDEQLLETLASLLNDRYSAMTASNTTEAKEILKKNQFDVVLLDVRLNEGTSGLDLLPFTQKLHNAPSVIMMSAFIDKPIAIHATNNGVVGILEKPYDLNQIHEQIERALKRRVGPRIKSAAMLKDGEISLDANNFRLVTKDHSLTLTKTEYQILSFFMERPNQWIQRERIEEQIWPGVQVSRNTLDTHLSNLKKRAPSLRTFFESRRGFGIRFIQENEAS